MKTTPTANPKRVDTHRKEANLRQINKYKNDCCKENEENMAKSIEELLKEIQLNLIQVAQSISFRDPGSIENKSDKFFATKLRR